MIFNRVFAVSALACGLGYSVGCGTHVGFDMPETTAVRPSIEVVDANEADGRLILDFHKDGRTIRFELLLGPTRQIQSTETNPDAPTHEVDARVLDAGKQPLYMQMGGDAFISSTWRMKPIENIDVAGRIKDFGLLTDSVPELHKLEVAAGLVDLKKTAIQIGSGVDSMYDKEGVQGAPNLQNEAGGTLKANSTWVGHGSASEWDYRIHRQWSGYFNFDHSAVLLRAFSTTFLAGFASCNHGACALEMTSKCTRSSHLADDGTHTRYFYSEPSTSTSTGSVGCRTAWGLTLGNHTCNNDSQLQKIAITQDASQDTAGILCRSPLLYAPSCD